MADQRGQSTIDLIFAVALFGIALGVVATSIAPILTGGHIGDHKNTPTAHYIASELETDTLAHEDNGGISKTSMNDFIDKVASTEDETQGDILREEFSTDNNVSIVFTLHTDIGEYNSLDGHLKEEFHEEFEEEGQLGGTQLKAHVGYQEPRFEEYNTYATRTNVLGIPTTIEVSTW